MSVEYTNGTFLSSEGRMQIVYAKWADPEQSRRAILVISHGMSEYIDRYDEFARFMAEQGFVVYGNDHLGHGKSAPKPEDRGFFADKNGRYCLRDDIAKMVTIAKEENRAGEGAVPLKVVLLGHSMGSFIARLYCMKYSSEIDAAIFMGTSWKNPLGGIGALLAALGCLFCGKRSRSSFFQKVGGGAYIAQVKKACPGTVQTPRDWLNSDENEVLTYMKDKNAGFVFTMEGNKELIAMLAEINRKGWADSIRKNLPVLLISGENDPVGAMGKGVKRVEQDLQAAGIKDLALKIYPGMRHEILHEPGRKQVFQDILEWCTRRI
jgi:alpha-beta hydrolase superfamily lysophospholipase